MKNTNSTFIVSLFVFVSFFLCTSHTAGSPTRGLWMWGSSLNSGNIQSTVDKLADNHVNEVYLLVKGTAGTKTNATTITNFINSSHAKSIKVHLWYCVFKDRAYVNLNPGAHYYHSPKPDVSLRPYRMTDESVNPFYPGYLEYVLDNIGYFVNNFNCDGIHLDYIRYSHLIYSFDPYSLEKAASLGCDTTRLLGFFDTPLAYAVNASGSGFVNSFANNDPDVVKWVNMRKKVVFDYIDAIRDTILKVKPHLKLTAAFMPEGAYNPNFGDVYYAQNYAMNSTILDMISPMAYFKSYGQKTSWLRSVTESAISRVDPRCKISAGIQGFDGVTAAEMAEQIDFAMEGGSYGVLIFRYGSFSENIWNTIKTTFQGFPTSITKIEDGTHPDYNYPNPFHSTTEISFKVTNHCSVSLMVYDAQGKLLGNLINNKMNPGTYKVSFDGSHLPSGIYFYQLNLGGKSSTKKMILKK